MGLKILIFRLFLHSCPNTSNVEGELLCLEITLIDFDIFDLVSVVFELLVGFHLVVQMRKDLIVYSKFKVVALLNDI